MWKIKILFNAETDVSGGGGGLMGGAPPAEPPAAAPPSSPDVTPPSDQGVPAAILGDDGKFSPQWYAGNEDLAQFSKSLDKFNDPQSLAKSYAILERNRAVPGSESDEAAVVAFRQANGIPQNAAEYDIQIPENLPDGVTLDSDGVNAYKEVFHEMNLAPHQAQALMEKHIEMTGQSIAESQAQSYQAQQEAAQGLQKEWGVAYGANLDKAQKTFDGICVKAGVNPDEVSFTSDPAFAKIMAAVADTTSESSIIGGGGSDPFVGGGGKSEANNIMTNKSHPDYSAYWDTQDPRHAEVSDRVASMIK